MLRGAVRFARAGLKKRVKFSTGSPAAKNALAFRERERPAFRRFVFVFRREEKTKRMGVSIREGSKGKSAGQKSFEKRKRKGKMK
jgi:hypothetical protein